MCTDIGTVVNEGQICAGCQWSKTLSSTMNGTNCVFTYTVQRSNCTNSRDETFTGVITVPCSQTTTLTFPCNSGSGATGYKLVLKGCPCPIEDEGVQNVAGISPTSKLT